MISREGELLAAAEARAMLREVNEKKAARFLFYSEKILIYFDVRFYISLS